MSIIDTLMKAYPPKCRADIIDATEDLIAEYQSGNGNEVKIRDELFYLHLGLVAKLCRQKRNMLHEDDVVTCCLECILPAAKVYNIEAGHKRFTWVSFFMQRSVWKINEYYHKTNQLVYIPKAPWEKGVRFKYDYVIDISAFDNEKDVDDSYPTRWEAVYQYEINNPPEDPDDELDIIIFKLNYLNKNTSKIAKRLKVDRLRIKEGLERIVSKMAVYYQNNPFNFD